MVRIKSPRDFAAGALFIVIGIVGMWVAREYDYGTAARMGPGYFPIMVSGLLTLIGVVVGVQSVFFVNGPAIATIRWRSMLLIFAGVVCFGALIEFAGLAASIIATIAIGAYATTEATWKGTLALALSLAVFCVLIFVYALGQPIPIFGGR